MPHEMREPLRQLFIERQARRASTGVAGRAHAPRPLGARPGRGSRQGIRRPACAPGMAAPRYRNRQRTVSQVHRAQLARSAGCGKGSSDRGAGTQSVSQAAGVRTSCIGRQTTICATRSPGSIERSAHATEAIRRPRHLTCCSRNGHGRRYRNRQPAVLRSSTVCSVGKNPQPEGISATGFEVQESKCRMVRRADIC